MPSSGIQGDPWSDPGEAIEVLKAAGIVFISGTTFRIPESVTCSSIEENEVTRAAYYLVCEWDFSYEVEK